MAKKVQKASKKRFRGGESFIPMEEPPEDLESNDGELEAMGLPRVDSDEAMSEEDSMLEDDESIVADEDASAADEHGSEGPEDDDDEEDDDDDEEEEEYEEEMANKMRGNRSLWGTKLSNYYDEGSDEYTDEEDVNARLAEAERIAKELYDDVEDEDAEVEDLEEEGAEEEDPTTLDSLLEDLSASLREQSAKVELPSDFMELNDSEKMDYFEREHPEFLLLLREFKEKSALMNEQILRIVNKKEAFKLCTPNGMEYLDMRNELMLMYLSYLSYYLLLKSHGISIENHPVINRLLEIRIMLDKAKPIESRLQFEINKMLEEKESKEEGKQLRARLHLMEVDENDDGPIYRAAPRREMMETDAYAKHQKKLMRKERFVSGRKMLDEMEEQNSDEGDEPTGSSKASKMMKALLEREKYEMDHMKRLPMTKMAKKELRQFNKKHAHKQEGFTLDDISGFASGVLNEGERSRKNVLSGLNAAAQTLRQDILEAQKLKSSDAFFLPQSKKGKKAEPVSVAAPQRPKRPEFDDEFAKMKKQQSELLDSVKQSKEEGHKRKFERKVIDGKREASADIIRNKGLTRKRKKTAGNARVANRAKFEKKQVAFRSKTGGDKSEAPGYSGESTGINARKKKSVNF